MGRKDKKRKLPGSFKDRVKASLSAKNPILLFLVVFGTLMGIFYAFWVTEFFKENIFNSLLDVNAKIASGILNLFGFGTTASGKEIYNSQFTVSVKRGCDAIEPAALFVSAVLAFPSSFKMKLHGIVVGILFLLAVNLFRIVSLFLTGIYAPSYFELMHLEVWQVVFILLALASWIVWMQWAMRSKQPVHNVAG